MLLAAFVWAAAPAPGQEVEIPEVFSETIDVRVVNVEVVVTDRAGNRVHGLEVADFELLVDGEPTPIDYFTEVEDGFASDGGAGDIAAVPSLDPSAPVGTNFLIFIDDLFSIERDRNRVLDHLANDLGELGPSDRIAAVAYDGQTAEILTAWTDSADRFADALVRARSRPSHGVHRLLERNQVAQDRQRMADHLAGRNRSGLLGSAGPVTSGLANDDSRQDLTYRESLSNQLESSVLAAMATMRRFANRPGRKVMLLLAGGWPRSVEIFSRELLPGGFLPVNRRVMSEHDLYGPLVSTANLIGFSLYPVDVPGLTRNFYGDASRGFGANARPENARPGAGHPRTGRHDPQRPEPARPVDRRPALAQRAPGRSPDERRRGHPLVLLARLRTATPGGQQVPRDRRAAEGPSGPRGPHARGLRRHVARPRTRHDGEGSLLFGDPPEALALDVQFSEPVRTGRRRMSVPVEVAIPLDEIQLLPTGDEWLSVVEVRVTAMDEGGNRSEVSFERVPISGPQEPQPGQIFYYQTDLELRRREHSYVITVHDPLTGTSLTSTGTVSPN